MRQRIALIAALLHDPSLLILDEPLLGLDVTSAMIVKHLIQTLAERGKAILYCSHVLEVVEKVCSHVIVLRKGRTLAYGHPAELMKSAGQSSLEHAFAHLVEGDDAPQASLASRFSPAGRLSFCAEDALPYRDALACLDRFHRHWRHGCRANRLRSSSETSGAWAAAC